MSSICPVIPYDCHRVSVKKRQVCDTAYQYETFGCYSATIWGVHINADYSIYEIYKCSINMKFLNSVNIK